MTISRGRKRLSLAVMALAMLLLVLGVGTREGRAYSNAPHGSLVSSDIHQGEHLGVASCASATCHGRQEPTGAVVRQDEVARWQDLASPAGAHSRAWRVLGSARGLAIAGRLGIGDPQKASQCLGCHSDPAPARGPAFRLADGVGCEACHGASDGWIASHAATAATHARNVAQGLIPLDDARVRAGVCLDCHLGSERPGQFVDHRIMAAGHPRLSFELDLFSTLQQHWNVDRDYSARKRNPSAMQIWAVGQATAVARSLTLFTGPRANEGVFPEFSFFDCHTCHRRIGDDPGFRPSALSNPGRPAGIGMPAFQDENMIMLSAAAHVLAPTQATVFDAAARDFHKAFTMGPREMAVATARLRAATSALAAAFAARPIGRADTLGILAAVATGASERYTDYEASVQAVMAIDTLLAGLVRTNDIDTHAAASIRGQIDIAYRAVHDPNDYHALDFRAALVRAAAAIKGVAG